MKKTFSLAIAGLIFLSAASFKSTSVQAREIDCVNHWINPESKVIQCFDGDLNYMAVPPHNLDTPTANFSDSAGLIRRRATGLEMVMPNLVGQEIDLAEDYLLSMGVTLGSEQVHAQGKVAGEIIQQTPLPGTQLVKGQTVLLQYMGATINPTQVK